jgi:predicted transposase/invertase (TIGR01784 family)
MLESASLPETVRREYEEAQKKRFQISFYVADEKSKSKDEGKIEGREEGIEEGRILEKITLARKLLARNRFTLEEIVDDTGLTRADVEALQRGEQLAIEKKLETERGVVRSHE